MSVSRNWVMVQQEGFKAHKYGTFAKLLDDRALPVAYVQPGNVEGRPELISMTVLTSPADIAFHSIYVYPEHVANIAQVFADMIPPF